MNSNKASQNAGFNFKEINMARITKFEKEVLERIDEGVNLTENEFITILNKYTRYRYIQEEYGYEVTSSIVKIQDRHFVIHWKRLLGSEGQIDEYNAYFESQPIEVHEETRIEKRKIWVDDQGNVVF